MTIDGAGSLLTTQHTIYTQSSRSMQPLADESVDLVITSPPYPMIEMWDQLFARDNPEITSALERGDGRTAFELMHRELDSVWEETWRILRPGAFLCINIGDATRTVQGTFRLYSNHARIISRCESIGFQSLPLILWRKQTNAPNKFMGSGMLPSGAYVTLEHEYVMLFRKGSKRVFAPAESRRRRRSAFFWEERNTWFSDLWDLKGTRQQLPSNEARTRSAAYPLELAHRLVCMYSMQEDLVVDPFAGTGTTTAACILNGRNSAGFEIHHELAPIIRANVEAISRTANTLVAGRLEDHAEFVRAHTERRGTPPGHQNSTYGFPVVTSQEVELQLPALESLHENAPLHFTVHHTMADSCVGSKAPSLRLDSAPEEGEQLEIEF